MNSMTGYGRGESPPGDVPCVVECSSVNRKGIEINAQLPRELAALEVRIRELVLARVSRGRISVVVQFPNSAAVPATAVDLPFARHLVSTLHDAQRELGLSGSLDVNSLLTVPGFLRPSEQASADRWPAIEAALAAALDALLAMRQQEGAHLAGDLATRLATLESLRDQLATLAPKVITAYRAALQKRLDQIGLAIPVDENRLAAEIALFAERSDVSEELTRLASHFEQFREKLSDSEPAGRALEFLTQEIFRELNTLGAKAGDSAMSRLVVDAKAELDKMREQILNVE